jgi:D-aminopeptidase
VGNGFGKALGFTQVRELGNLETPVALTNTLSVFTAANALVDYTLFQPGNETVRSVNPVAGETNDGWLNDIRGCHVCEADIRGALSTAATGPVAEGNVGAGTGTTCLGFKGGIGTSSRKLPESRGGYTVGVLVQTNFGGILTINGAPVGEELGNHYLADADRAGSEGHGPDGSGPGDPGASGPGVDGSCMIVIATDAPLSARNLERLAGRSFLALGRVGSFMSNGSGDYAIAFSTHPGCRIPYRSDAPVRQFPDLGNDFLSPLFLAVVEATEEAVYNSLFMAEDMEGVGGHRMPGLPLDRTLEILDRYGARNSP